MIGAGVAITIATLFALIPSAPISGTARIIDGDTLTIEGKRIRLYGIDAPEASQLGGSDATTKLRSLTTDKDGLHYIVYCTKKATDRYERIVATCTANGNDLGGAMVRSGYAMDWPKYSDGRYAAQQIDAQQEGAGLWRTPTLFQPPWEYRHAHKR
jgi:endonuclease YncB( thermonuclease family)